MALAKEAVWGAVPEVLATGSVAMEPGGLVEALEELERAGELAPVDWESAGSAPADWGREDSALAAWVPEDLALVWMRQ